jgi:hypothetical protein
MPTSQLNQSLKNEIVKILEKEYLRRSLIRYFKEKGYDNFLNCPYPPTLLDVCEKIPSLNGIIELSYFVDDINMENNSLIVGWNIFVLGNKRIFIGNTVHNNLLDIENSIHKSSEHHNGPISIKNIIETICEFISKSNKLNDIHKSNKNQNAPFSYKSMKPRKPIGSFKRNA